MSVRDAQAQHHTGANAHGSTPSCLSIRTFVFPTGLVRHSTHCCCPGSSFPATSTFFHLIEAWHPEKHWQTLSCCGVPYLTDFTALLLLQFTTVK